MRRNPSILILAALLGVSPACARTAEPPPDTALAPSYEGPDARREKIAIRLVPVAEGFEQPTDIQPVPGQPDRLIILEKTGAAKWLDPKTGESGPWLRREVLTRSEQGLLGLAFHPKFKENGRFFVNYSVEVDGKKTTRVAEWAVEPGKPIAATTPREVRAVIEVTQPYANHNAGQLAFGPDGLLYVGLGDGGAANDPHNHGQDLSTLLGTMLRLDVDRGEPYAIPPDNPFVGRDGARAEIWAYGLRNPWRYAFAPDGRLVVADVGQNAWEEITLVGRGENHGWKVREGGHCFPSGEKCLGGDVFTDPIWEYPRSEGISVTGGHVYTGKGIPALTGRYVFGDYGSGRLWALALPADKRLQPESAIRALGRFPLSPTAFGVGADGEMYVADFARGRIYRFSDD
ncbi:MAG: PQQ-dependent sugar dehydrogenase [bacterium]